MHRTENTKRNSNAKTQNSGKNVDKNSVLHRGFKNLNCRAVISIAITEISLKESLIIAIDRHSTYPAKVAHKNVLVRAKLVALFCQLLLIKLGGIRIVLQTCLICIDLYNRTVVRNHGVYKEHQKGENQRDNNHIAQSLKNVFSHGILPFFRRQSKIFPKAGTCRLSYLIYSTPKSQTNQV